MSISRRATTLALLVLAALWLATNFAKLAFTDPAALRFPAIVLTGMLAIASACLAAVLSLRSRPAEQFFGGLDKLYRSHRVFGVAALVLGFTHWVIVKVPALFGSSRGGGPHHGGATGGSAVTVGGFQHFIASQQRFATGLGNWGLWPLGVLVGIALMRAVPYRLFYLSHRVIALALLLLAYHSLVLFPFAQWATPIGVVLAPLLAAGSLAAVLSLVGRIGARRRASGVLTRLDYYPDLAVLHADLAMDADWPGHAAGQFAYVHGGRWEGQHPFTIASAWDPAERTITFVAKELGDFTSGLAHRAKVGAVAQVEGPYGKFTFQDRCPVQIWIAGGVGVTPFVARLHQRRKEPDADTHEVHFFFTSENDHAEGMVQLAALAAEAGAAFRFLHTPRDGFLTGEQVRDAVANWRDASIWFCGPEAFGQAIRNDFTAHGMDADRIHQELFGWR